MMNDVAKITIREGSIEECLEIQEKIPEFTPNLYQKSDLEKRLSGRKSLLLIAEVDTQIVGFKIGYAETDTQFYSWLGGVLPEFRRLKIAQKLALWQENWAKENNFKRISLKTRNHFKAMLIFALQNGFQISALETKSTLSQNRIILEKEIS